MYQIIAAEYDSLFPHSQDKTDFVESQLTCRTGSIVDLGCATGELLISLYKPGRNLIGADLDQTMVAMATKKVLNQKIRNIKFITQDMTRFLKEIDPESQDMLLCFGNTIAYLRDPVQMNEFFKNGHNALLPGGKFIIQILNYDNPRMGAGFKFPDLNTEKICFSRSYTNGEKGGLFFQTQVSQKGSKTVFKDTHCLYPFTRSQIEKAALSAGFKSCQVLGNYKGAKPDQNDFARLFILEKEVPPLN